MDDKRLEHHRSRVRIGKDFDPSVVVELITEIDRLHEADRWIPVSEKLPKNHERVIIFTGEQVYEGYYDSDRKLWYSRNWQCIVTHWRPLPAPPL